MATINRVFGGLSIGELKDVSNGRRHLVWALEKLVFRKETFTAAATLLRRLAAAETEDGISNNASGQFKQLYQLYLSGTQADPVSRLLVLDEGLASSDPKERAVSFAALDTMLDSSHFGRSGGSECVRIALRSTKLKPYAIPMIGSGKLQPNDVDLVVSLLQRGDVEPRQCAPLSYGRGVDHLKPSEFMPLLDELSKHGSSGLWAALEIISMYLHGGREADATLVRKVKEILLAPELLKAVNRQTVDGYILEQMVSRLLNGRRRQSQSSPPPPSMMSRPPKGENESSV